MVRESGYGGAVGCAQPVLRVFIVGLAVLGALCWVPAARPAGTVGANVGGAAASLEAHSAPVSWPQARVGLIADRVDEYASDRTGTHGAGCADRAASALRRTGAIDAGACRPDVAPPGGAGLSIDLWPPAARTEDMSAAPIGLRVTTVSVLRT